MSNQPPSPKPTDSPQPEDGSGLYAPTCSPSDVIALVRRYNRWRKGEDTLEMEHPKRIGEALDAICDLAEKMQAERDEMREWIKNAAPVFESACCIVIEERVDRIGEIQGCQAILETCPVDFVRMPHLILENA